MSLDIDQIALHQLIKRDEQNLELSAARFLTGAECDGRGNDGRGIVSTALKTRPRSV